MNVFLLFKLNEILCFIIIVAVLKFEVRFLIVSGLFLYSNGTLILKCTSAGK